MLLALANCQLPDEQCFYCTLLIESGCQEGQACQISRLIMFASVYLILLNCEDDLADCVLQESIREIEESLNQQLFCTPEMTLDKEQVVLFDQSFDQSVFPAITLQVRCYNNRL